MGPPKVALHKNNRTLHATSKPRETTLLGVGVWSCETVSSGKAHSHTWHINDMSCQVLRKELDRRAPLFCSQTSIEWNLRLAKVVTYRQTREHKGPYTNQSSQQPCKESKRCGTGPQKVWPYYTGTPGGPCHSRNLCMEHQDQIELMWDVQMSLSFT